MTAAPASDPDWRDVGRSLATARVFDLAQPLESSTPCSPAHGGFRMTLRLRHELAADQGVAAANELITMGGHVGTHIDALSHISLHGRLHGGADAVVASADGRFATHGVETVPPMVCPGVLADIPALLGLDRLPPQFEITGDHLRRALTGTPVEPGDVVVVRTGWPRLYSDPAAYLGHDTGVPGLGADAARFLAGIPVRAVGIDTIATERIRAGRGHAELHAHTILLVEHGITIIEVMNLEDLAIEGRPAFLFVAIPLKIVGATGSPIRPLALCLSR
jgi:kynurenine formamidase